MAMDEKTLTETLSHCGCGLDHTTGDTGECDVPALVEEVRRLRAITESLDDERRALLPVIGRAAGGIGQTLAKDARDAIAWARRSERERCAATAQDACDSGGCGSPCADAIGALPDEPSPEQT